jgi:hypothetical protein
VVTGTVDLGVVTTGPFSPFINGFSIGISGEQLYSLEESVLGGAINKFFCLNFAYSFTRLN